MSWKPSEKGDSDQGCQMLLLDEDWAMIIVFDTKGVIGSPDKSSLGGGKPDCSGFKGEWEESK